MAEDFGGKLIVLLLLSFKCSCLRTRALTNEDTVSTMEVEAVVGRTGSLPCDIEPDSHEDRVYMVLWFRHAGGKPLYSFDVRGRSFNKALHWSDPLAFGKRAYFVTMSRPSSLTVEAVQLDDEGIYRCRVDFKNSPTRNFQIRLNVIVPPHKLLLYDEAGRDLAGVVGPLEEGSNFTLLCELRGGRPQPTLSWLINNTPVDDHIILKNDGKVIISKINVSGAERSWLNSTVRCQATNTALLSPHERTARVEMNLRPTSVIIVEKPGQMSADSEVTLVCITHGSRPTAQVTWYRENRKYTRGKHSEYINDTSTVSKLIMIPQPEDDGTTIRCRADNPILRVAIEDSFKMSVVYRPVVTMSLGSTLNPNDIKEGDDVYFECNIKSNPKEHRISWYHNDEQVSQNMSSGVFISTKSLVLQRVTRQDVGLYSCRAANQIGETTSQSVFLRVQYAPTCAQLTPVVIGARLDESLRVRCTVSADPADVAFYWQFNNSGESFQVSPARYVSTGGTASELRYRAASERDYGALLCRATNTVGTQHKPCVFQIVPAVPLQMVISFPAASLSLVLRTGSAAPSYSNPNPNIPQPRLLPSASLPSTDNIPHSRPSSPRNCTASRIVTKDMFLSVRCLAGYDGGLHQHFLLEAVGDNSRLLANVTTAKEDPVVWMNVSWSVLETMTEDELLTVSARNTKGVSDPVMLRELVFKDAAKQTEETDRVLAKFPLAAAFAGSAAFVTAIGAIIALVFKKRHESSTTSKRPCQSVVQVDAQGRRYLIAYPTTHSQEKMETKPDILNPKHNEAEGPRVVLESSDNTSYIIREANPLPHSTCLPHTPHDNMMPQR